MSAIRSLAGVTIVVPDLDAAIAAYRDWLGYVAGPITTVGDALARRWGADAASMARMVALTPESGEKRFVRMVEGQADPAYRPLASLGWIAAEIIVQDVDALAERLGMEECPFEIIGAPAVLDFDFTDQIKAMQILGPGGEVLYLTEVGEPIPGFDLPVANSFVGQLFIVVLAADDLTTTASSYASPNHPRGRIFDARVAIISAAYGLPADYRHRLTTVAFEEASLIEIDAAPPAASPRGRSSIGLPSGIALVSFVAKGHCASDTRQSGAVDEWFELCSDFA